MCRSSISLLLLFMCSVCVSEQRKDCLKMYPLSYCDKHFPAAEQEIETLSSSSASSSSSLPSSSSSATSTHAQNNALESIKSLLKRGSVSLIHHPLLKDNTNIHTWNAYIEIGREAWRGISGLAKIPTDKEISEFLYLIFSNTTIKIDEKSLPKFIISSEQSYVELSELFAKRRSSGSSSSSSDSSSGNSRGSKIINENFVGQPLVVEKLTTYVEDVKNGFRLNKGPRVYVFVGPPGTGKTYLGHLLGKELQRNVLKIDMVNYKDAQDIDSFIGPRTGVVGEGHLFEGLRSASNSVVILDEIEKAHPSIISEFLLPIFSDGALQAKKSGERLNVEDSIWILTSNCFEDFVSQKWKKQITQGQPADINFLEQLSNEVVAKFQDPEYMCLGPPLRKNPFASSALYDRVQGNVMTFTPHLPSDAEKIVDLELEAVHRYFSTIAPLNLIWTPQVSQFFAKRTAGSSVRTLQKAIISTCENLLRPLHLQKGNCRTDVILDVKQNNNTNKENENNQKIFVVVLNKTSFSSETCIPPVLPSPSSLSSSSLLPLLEEGEISSFPSTLSSLPSSSASSSSSSSSSSSATDTQIDVEKQTDSVRDIEIKTLLEVIQKKDELIKVLSNEVEVLREQVINWQNMLAVAVLFSLLLPLTYYAVAILLGISVKVAFIALVAVVVAALAIAVMWFPWLLTFIWNALKFLWQYPGVAIGLLSLLLCLRFCRRTPPFHLRLREAQGRVIVLSSPFMQHKHQSEGELYTITFPPRTRESITVQVSLLSLGSTVTRIETDSPSPSSSSSSSTTTISSATTALPTSGSKADSSPPTAVASTNIPAKTNGSTSASESVTDSSSAATSITTSSGSTATIAPVTPHSKENAEVSRNASETTATTTPRAKAAHKTPNKAETEAFSEEEQRALSELS